MAASASRSLVVHHLANSRSHRVLVALEELGTPYELRVYQRDPVTHLAPPELRAVHPLGKSPVVTDGDLVLAESGAILEYLAETYDTEHRVSPPREDRRAWLQMRYWLHFAEGTAMPTFIMLLVFNKVVESTPFIVRPISRAIANAVKDSFIQPRIKENLDLMESALAASGAWVCGERFTIADAQLFFVAEAGASSGYMPPAAYPHLHRFIKDMRARPSFQRALEKGGPVTL